MKKKERTHIPFSLISMSNSSWNNNTHNTLYALQHTKSAIKQNTLQKTDNAI